MGSTVCRYGELREEEMERMRELIMEEKEDMPKESLV
jgi:hypothetical protein